MGSPETALWRAVIEQLFMDAVRPTIPHDRAGAALLDRAQARDYLTQWSRDLMLVCDYASLDAGAVIDRAQRLAAHNWSDIEEIAT